MEDCEKKLVRAEKMIGGLEGEKTRWTETVAQLGEQQDLLVGDCLIAAGMISYAGKGLCRGCIMYTFTRTAWLMQ